MLERKDRVTHSGMSRMAETLNKLILNTELSKWLLLKRVHEISARMTLVHLKPGQQLNLEESSMYIVLDGKVRISTPE
jgi:quercetin dioxygenase-like cupin family protein